MFKKKLIYFILIIFGIAKQISKLLLFAIPIKSIKIIDRGEVIPEIKTVLRIINIDIISNRDQYICLSILFVFLILGIFFINFINETFVLFYSLH